MSPSLLNLLPAAVGQSGPVIIHAEVGIPAPTAFTDPLYVILPDWSVDIPLTITDWPAAHGDTLPLVGDTVDVLVNNRGEYRCVGWTGLMTFPTQSSQTYYLTPTSSDVSGDYQMLSAPYASKTPASFTGITTGQILREWVTQPLVPALSYLPAGQFETHIHAVQTAGNQTVQLYGEFWEESASGTTIALIGSSQVSKPLTGTEIEYRLFTTTTDVYTFASLTSRVDFHLKAIVGGAGGANVTVYVGGESDSHVTFPSGTAGPIIGSAWITPTLGNSWVQGTDGTINPATKYMKDPMGFVHVRGFMTSGTNNATAFTLPAGYRPGQQYFAPGVLGGGAFVYVGIDTSGNFAPSFGASPTSSGAHFNLPPFLAEN